MTRHELLTRMSSQELTDWMVYAQVEPFGEERRAIATETALIANVFRDGKKRSAAYMPDDFLFRQPEPDELEPVAVAQKIGEMLGAPKD